MILSAQFVKYLSCLQNLLWHHDTAGWEQLGWTSVQIMVCCLMSQTITWTKWPLLLMGPLSTHCWMDNVFPPDDLSCCSDINGNSTFTFINQFKCVCVLKSASKQLYSTNSINLWMNSQKSGQIVGQGLAVAFGFSTIPLGHGMETRYVRRDIPK